VLEKTGGDFEHRGSLTDGLLILENEIRAILGRAGITPDGLLKSICIAPGVYVEKGTSMKWVPYHEKNSQDDVRDHFSRLLGHRPAVDHSTKLSLLGESIAGKARGCRNVVYVDFGYGLGCSIMVNGQIYFGPNNSAGEIGYFYSSLDEFSSFRVVPFEFGALEGHVSGRALRAKGIEAAGKYRDTRLLRLAEGGIGGISAKTVFDAARQGDPVAYSVIKESFTYFNLALCNIINMLTPELVLIGGGISKSGDFLLGFIENEIREKVLMMPKIEISELKSEASILGGIHYLIIHTDFLEEL
jgi:glucokinase